MTFLYCNDRWRQLKKKDGPGPGEYDVASKAVTEPEEGAISQGKLYRKNNYEKKEVERIEEEFREMINRQMGVGQSGGGRRQTKRGKIRKNLSMAQKLSSTKQNTDPDSKLLIKNDIQEDGQPNSRNKWGNMRIKEMLNQRNEQTKIPPKKYSCGRNYSQTALVEDRTRFKEDLRELENIFNSNRKGSNQKLTIKLFHQNREIKINKGFALKSTDNGVRMSLNGNQEFQVEPAAVYKIERMEIYTPQISRPATPEYGSSNHSVQMKGGREETMQTGLEENSLEDSMEYIEDATPGPGSYNIDREVSEKRPGSRVGKFGVTMQRFKNPKKYNTPQSFINPKYPNFKKQSKATQQNVGFGRSTKHQTDKMDNIDIFYEDVNNLQHKSQKWLSKQRKENIGFESCKQRFSHEMRESDEESPVKRDPENEEIIEQCKPNSIFISKVTRELYLNSNTEEVDFHGQNYNCLANKLKKDKEHLEDFQLHPPAFMTNSTRFKYQQNKPKEKVAELKLVKIQELKQRKEAKKKKVQRGFTFLKEERKDALVCQSHSPSPDKYDSSPRWIKDSYNIRFHS